MIEDTLEAKVREGARVMLAAALEEEVNAFLGRNRYERSDEFRGYRNGYHRSRELTVGVSGVEVKVPRVSDVPEEVSPDGYSSGIVRALRAQLSTDAGAVSEAVHGGFVDGRLRAGVKGVGWRDDGAECERYRETEESLGERVPHVARQSPRRVPLCLNMG